MCMNELGRNPVGLALAALRSPHMPAQRLPRHRYPWLIRIVNNCRISTSSLNRSSIRRFSSMVFQSAHYFQICPERTSPPTSSLINVVKRLVQSRCKILPVTSRWSRSQSSSHGRGLFCTTMYRLVMYDTK